MGSWDWWEGGREGGRTHLWQKEQCRSTCSGWLWWGHHERRGGRGRTTPRWTPSSPSATCSWSSLHVKTHAVPVFCIQSSHTITTCIVHMFPSHIHVTIVHVHVFPPHTLYNRCTCLAPPWQLFSWQDSSCTLSLQTTIYMYVLVHVYITQSNPVYTILRSEIGGYCKTNCGMVGIVAVVSWVIPTLWRVMHVYT